MFPAHYVTFLNLTTYLLAPTKVNISTCLMETS